MYADSGHRRSRRHCGSRAIMAPGGGGGMNQQEPVAGLSGHRLLTAFPYICGEGVSKFVGGLSGHKLAAKGGIEGCLSGRLVRPGRASTFFYYYLRCFVLPNILSFRLTKYMCELPLFIVTLFRTRYWSFGRWPNFPATTFSPTLPFDGISHRTRKNSPMTMMIPIMREEASMVIPYRTALSIPMVRNEEASSGDTSMVLNSGFSDCSSTLVCFHEPSSFCSFSLWYFLMV